MTTELVQNTRGSFRLSVLEAVRAEITELLTPIEGGPLDGIKVVSAGEVTEALERVKTSPLPRIDDQTAEVRTPSDVYVDTICPECDLPTRILVQLSAVLETTREAGSTIKLKAKAKGKTHVHHQLSLEVDKADGQESFDLTDIVSAEDALTDEERAAGESGLDPAEDSPTESTPVDREAPDPPDAEDEAWMNAPMGTPAALPEDASNPESDDGTAPLDQDDEDLRPSGVVNVDELRGAIDRDNLDVPHTPPVVMRDPPRRQHAPVTAIVGAIQSELGIRVQRLDDYGPTSALSERLLLRGYGVEDDA